MTLPILVAGKAASHARLIVPGTGVWHVDLRGFDDDAPVTGRVAVTLGAATLMGIVDDRHSGVFGGKRRVRVLAGAGAWQSDVPKFAHHNDAGVRVVDVAQSVALACGETLGAVDTGARFGADFTRLAGPAVNTLEACAARVSGGAWYVDFAGVTQLAARATSQAPAKAYDVIDFDPTSRVVSLVLDDLLALQPGAVIASFLPVPLTITGLVIDVTPDAIRAQAWCQTAPVRGRTAIADALESIATTIAGRRIPGVYRYRVVAMAGDRVALQVVRPDSGVPDEIAVAQWTAPGIHAQLTPGSECMVAFEGADPTGEPLIVAFAPRGAQGFVPVSLVLADGAQPVARQGDLVRNGGVGTVITFDSAPTPSGTPTPMFTDTPYLVSFSTVPPTLLRADPLYGIIAGGSPTVRSG